MFAKQLLRADKKMNNALKAWKRHRKHGLATIKPLLNPEGDKVGERIDIVRTMCKPPRSW